jgi:hypothetical protein
MKEKLFKLKINLECLIVITKIQLVHVDNKIKVVRYLLLTSKKIIQINKVQKISRNRMMDKIFWKVSKIRQIFLLGVNKI